MRTVTLYVRNVPDEVSASELAVQVDRLLTGDEDGIGIMVVSELPDPERVG